MFKFLVLGLFLILSVSCSKNPLNGDLEKNLKELDKIYGKCDNPNRQYTKGQYDVCKDKERATC